MKLSSWTLEIEFYLNVHRVCQQKEVGTRGIRATKETKVQQKKRKSNAIRCTFGDRSGSVMHIAVGSGILQWKKSGAEAQAHSAA
jgi:hypothetical protein